MELRDFISETLIQIVQGINDAQEALKDTDCAINPRDIVFENRSYVNLKNKLHIVHDIDFNIALTNTSNSEDKTGIGVMLGSCGIGNNKTSSGGNTSNTNISFSVPVVFPSVDNENKPLPPIVISRGRTHHY